MRTIVAVLAILSLAACGSDSEPEPEEFDVAAGRVVIVSGDGQEAPVLDPASASGSLVPVAAPAEGVLPLPLVVEIVDTSAASQSVGTITGPGLTPTFAVVPAGTPTYWHVAQEGCGEPFGTPVETDDNAQATNFWRLGTKAGVECEMEVGRIVNGAPVVDTVFTVTFLPGPVDHLIIHSTGAGIPEHVAPGDTIDARAFINYAEDVYRNTISAAAVRALPDSLVGWAWYDRSQNATLPRPTAPTDFGWDVVVPDFSEYDPALGSYHPGLMFWINDVPANVVLTFESPAP